MHDISLWGALLAGLLSFVSPCVLPLVPPYLCYLGGVSTAELKASPHAANHRSGAQLRLVAQAFTFVLGFSTVFVVLGATASAIGRLAIQYFDVLSVIGGSIICIAGLHFLGVFRIPQFHREVRVRFPRHTQSTLGAYTMGLAFAFGWTPCVGPVLATILFVAGSKDTIAHGVTLLVAYSFGLGLPFIATALFAPQLLSRATALRQHLGTFEKIMGLLLVLVGILMLTGQFSFMAYGLLSLFPVLGTIG